MQRLAFVVFLLALASTRPADAQPVAAAPSPVAQALSVRADGRKVADELSQLVGIQLTPLLGMTVLGSLNYFGTPSSQRGQLPWHDQPYFWGPGIVLMLVFFFGHRVPFVRHAFKQLKLIESKVFAAVSTPIVAKALAVALAMPIGHALAAAWSQVVPSAYAADGGAAALSDFAVGAGELVGFVLGVVVAAAVWLAGHSVNVLVVINPFGPLDWALKGLKLAALLLLVTCARISPIAGVLLSVTYVSIALLIAGWSFRLTVFGMVFSWDFLTFGSRRHRVDPNGIVAFSSASRDVPVRTLGTLSTGGSGIVFTYRPWLVLTPRSIAIDAASGVLSIGKGLVSPVLLQTPSAPERPRTLFRLPPRYRPHASAVAEALGGLRVEDVSLGRGVRAAIAWARQQITGRPTTQEVEPAVTT